MESLYNELKRRNVFRVGLAYAVVSWLLLQVGSVVVPYLGLPDWTMPFLIFILAMGLPLVLVFAWAYELTPEGLKPSREVQEDASVSASTGKRLNQVTIGVLGLAVALLLVDRFRGDVGDDPIAEVTAALETTSDESLTSIAVLPFVNMSSDADQVYFSDGISEEILNVLAQIPNLHVTSRSSAFQFRGGEFHIPTVAKQLGVANVLEGSVRKSGTRIRITAQLIDAANDKHLWSQTYNRELTDIFKIQDEISAAIVEALYVHLGLEKPVPKPVQEIALEAYRLYLLGRRNFEMRTGKSLHEAIRNFDQALAIAPDHAPSYTGKADAYMLLNSYGELSLSQSLAKAEPLIKRALELDPELAEAHTSRGFALQAAGQLEASLEAFDRAIALNPNLVRAWHWRAVTLRAFARFPEELESWQQAHRVDPLSPQIISVLGQKMLSQNRLEEAQKLLQSLAVAAPDSDRFTDLKLSILLHEGRWADSIKVAMPNFESNPTQGSQFRLHFHSHYLRAYDRKTSTLSPARQLGLDAFMQPQAAWTLFKAMPEDQKIDPDNRTNAIWAATILGKHEEVISLVNTWVGLDETMIGPLFEQHFQLSSTAPFVAVSRRATGDQAGADRLIAQCDRLIAATDKLETDGTHAIFEAEVHALKGEGDAAIADLKLALSAQAIAWFMLDWPPFDSLRDRSDFQDIVRSVDAKVNEERAKLGWEPIN